MKHILTLILTTLFSLSTKAQLPADAVLSPYDFKTTLQGGYHIAFQTDDSMQYLYLKKGKKTIAEIAATSKGMPYKNLGYIGADYTHYFVLVHSYGGGNPRYIELVKKSTGQNRLLSIGAAMVGVDEQQQYLLYSDHDVPNKKDKMTLLNIRTWRKEKFPFPNEMLDYPEVLNKIHLTRLTKKQLAITYETENGQKKRIYQRAL